ILYELTKKLSPNEKKLIFDIANGEKKVDLALDIVPIENDNEMMMETKSVESFVYENKGVDFSDEEISLFDSSLQSISNFSIGKSELEARF
ncbi:hypothetical protein BpHYR1_009649, partial [Brachionus plicatilis]